MGLRELLILFVSSLVSQQNNFTFKWIVLLCLFLITVLLALSLGKRKRYNLPPGPRGLPFLGYSPFLGKVHHKTLAELSKKYGPVFSLPLGGARVIVLNTWESVKEAMEKNATLDKQSAGIDLPSGLGFGVASGQVWSEHRRFSMKIVKDIGIGRPKWEDMLHEEVDEFLQGLKQQQGKPVDPLSVFSLTFTNNMLSLVFGRRLPNHDAEYITEMVDLTMSISPTMLSNFFPRLCKVLNSLGLYDGYDHKQKLKEYDQFMKNLINKRLKLEETKTEDSFVTRYYEEMQNKLKSGEKTTLDEVSMYANVQALILGGIETTRTSLLWLLIAMAEHQEVQDKVHEELDNVLGREGAMRWADRTKVPYTFACILEAQRWETVAPILIFRVANEDTTVHGYDIPKGTSITTNSWALHNDKKYWKEPEKYNPARMLLHDGKQINFKPDSYNPFSHGRRGCPGESIAMMELLVYFTKIMQKFTVTPDEELTVKRDVCIGITNQPVNFQLRFLPRD